MLTIIGLILLAGAAYSLFRTPRDGVKLNNENYSYKP